MNCFCGSINPNGDWDIFKFKIGDEESFYGHSKMIPGDILVLVVGKQVPQIESGAYAILQCTSDIYREYYNDKPRIRVNAKCVYHSGSSPFIRRDDMSKYIHFPIRIPVRVKNDPTKFYSKLKKFLPSDFSCNNIVNLQL